MPRRRLRTLTLWTGTTLSLLIAAAFVVSAWYFPWISVPGGPSIGVYAGALEYENPSRISAFVGYYRHGAEWRYALVGMKWSTGFWRPLVYPFAAVAIPTLLVWRFGPKPITPGHCKCGYDLTGNTSGVCPECGRAV